MSEIIAGLPSEQHDFGMSKGHSPVADHVVCIDFDGTLVPWGPLMGDKALLPGAARSLMAFQRGGYEVVIWTSRVSPAWAESVVGPSALAIEKFIREQREYVIEMIRRGAPEFMVNRITSEKIPAEVYIDDKAVAFRGDWTLAFSQSVALLNGGAR